jgi:DNA-binding Lrp family transcriptional regulator
MDLDERDLALLHGMQIAPRVSWSHAASVLGSSPGALAARWDRLRDAGLAWVTAHPAGTIGRVVVALVEVDCLPGSRAEAVQAICADPRVATVEECARDRDLLLTVMTPTVPAMSRFVLDDLARLPGVQRTRTHLTSAIHSQGRDWRLNALSPDQCAAFERHAAGHPAPGHGPPADAWPLIEALTHDGRATAAELARVTGRNAATVRRQLPRLIASGLLAFRCEVAQVATEWPIGCTFVARVPVSEHRRTAAALATLAELRLCVSTTGGSNFLFTVWVRSLQRLLELEQLLTDKLPSLGIVGSAVTLRTRKRMGWVLGDDSRATGEVIPLTGLRPGELSLP